jgi:hypothetical protein
MELKQARSWFKNVFALIVINFVLLLGQEKDVLVIKVQRCDAHKAKG